MPQKITRSFRELVAEADAAVRTLDVSEAIALHGNEDVVFVDLRDIREVARTGTIAGAHHVPRGMLEFWIDPESPYHKPVFAEDKTFVFYCAGGWRSALAAKTARIWASGRWRICAAGWRRGSRQKHRSIRRRNARIADA